MTAQLVWKKKTTPYQTGHRARVTIGRHVLYKAETWYSSTSSTTKWRLGIAGEEEYQEFATEDEAMQFANAHFQEILTAWNKVGKL